MDVKINEIILLAPFEIKAFDLKRRAEDLEVNRIEDLDVGNALFKECQETLKEMRDVGKALLDPIKVKLEQAEGRIKEVCLPIADAKVVIERKMIDFRAAQERIRAEAAEIERKRLEEARRAEESLKRAEVARLAQVEAELKAEREKLDNEKDAMKKKEMEIEARQKAEAAKLEAARNENERQARENAAERSRIAAEAVTKTTDLEAGRIKLRGLTPFWKYRIINEDDVPRGYMSPDTVKINGAIKEGIRNIPGIEIYLDERMK